MLLAKVVYTDISEAAGQHTTDNKGYLE